MTSSILVDAVLFNQINRIMLIISNYTKVNGYGRLDL